MIDDEQAFQICQRNGLQLTKGPRLTRDVAEAMLRMEGEIEEQKGNYLRCCQLVAEMHAAATGEPGNGPKRGVVEDVEDLRAEWDSVVTWARRAYWWMEQYRPKYNQVLENAPASISPLAVATLKESA